MAHVRERLHAIRRSACAAVACLATIAPASAQEPPLLDLIATIEVAEPLSLQGLDRALGASLACRETRCERADVTIHGHRVRYVDVRFGRFGSLLILAGFPDTCLPVSGLKARFPSGETVMSCTDGVVCPDYRVARPWGRLSARLPDEPDAPSCVQQLVFDTSR